ncbi:hypothetical protein ITJ46_13820 [Rathayibacter sp. VKM Ac-2878]|nr:hypothetical protein [Rathayibacter sp. VKM Ac-2879]MBF4505014.1 hypothetical protein [Rathayibacter sp. VKM Ac-2878]
MSLLLGIISIFFGFLILAPTAGLVFGILGVRREPTGRTMAVWGIVLNSVMLGVAALLAALAFVGIVVPLLR